MKNIIKKTITAFGNLCGLSINIQWKRGKKSDFVVIDRFIFSPFLNKEKEVELYSEAITKADATWSDNFYKQCRYYSLAQVANMASQRFSNLDTAECGVWKGHSAYMLSKIFVENNYSGTFHIFDSFEGGLSNKVEKDKNLLRNMTDDEVKNEKEIFSSHESQVAKVLSDFNFIKLYAGWIPARFQEVSDKKFSFVHIDVDLYEPTLNSLKFFWPLLVDGGFIVVDDYSSSQFPGATKATNEFLDKANPSFFYKVPMGACFIVK